VIVFLNDRQLEIFEGARVKDAVLKYSKEKYRSTRSGETVVTDKYDNTVDPEGELADDQRLYLKKKRSFSDDT